MPKAAAVSRGTLVIRVLREDRLECVGELIGRAVTCLVSHSIAPGKFVSGGLFVQAPCLFCFTLLPVELCSGRPNCGATQSFGGKLTLAQVSAQAPRCERGGSADGLRRGRLRVLIPVSSSLFAWLRVCSIAIGKHGTCTFAISWDLFGR